MTAAYRISDPATSRIAAVNATRNASRCRILAAEALCIAGPDGLTDFELAKLTGVAQTSIGKRRHELMCAGLVVPLVIDDVSVRRPSPSGSPAGVYVWVGE